ncbi:MAG: N,N'-diacetylchitobiose phosphorylase [Clostridiales bacterium]|jgi:cellobiose phosphorylase|nr:N,N'-diacetylchitobiose phosphorylase [Clostridiales bacterium]
MQYGYFDSAKREYVITRPDTPEPWANYLGSPAYGAVISNNAAGYSFARSGADGRLIRYRFNELAVNVPGRYLYIRDRKSFDCWTNSWQPAAKPLSNFKAECRHGTAYTVIKSEYSGIATETAYYVPLDCEREVWRVKVKNIGSGARELSFFSYAEFTNSGNYEQDAVNLQYTSFISRTERSGNAVIQHINENVFNEDETKGTHRFLGLAGAEAVSHCGDREEFFGSYRGYSNPICVERGWAGGKDCYNGNAAGVLQVYVSLEPGEEKSFLFILGEGGVDEAAKTLSLYDAPERAESELEELKEYWHGKLKNLEVCTPDPSFNHSVNTWNAYQCFIAFIWSRAASFVYCGLRNGYGYRDTVQDIQGITHLAPEMAREKLRFMLSAQASNGAGLPLVKFNHNAGHEDALDESREEPYFRSDDALWLFPTVDKYVKESGNLSFYDEVIPFAEKDEGTVFEHLKRAIGFSYSNMTESGLPAGLEADWNDCLRTGEFGVSSFVSFQLFLALGILAEIAGMKGDLETKREALELREKLGLAIDLHLAEDDRYIRAITEDGQRIGSKDSQEARLWLNPQSWAVISGFASGKRAETILNAVNLELNTEYGVKLFDPPFRIFGLPVARMTLFNPGTKENAGIFSQTQGWAILAETMIGNGDRAYEYYNKANPAAMNDRADIRRLEPYAHGQFIESDDSPFAGRAHVHWLTGTASTVMVSAVEGILGLHPQCGGILIDPCIPSSWSGFRMKKVFRGKVLKVEVINSSGSQKGVKKASLNGNELESGFIPFDKLKDGSNDVVVYL